MEIYLVRADQLQWIQKGRVYDRRRDARHGDPYDVQKVLGSFRHHLRRGPENQDGGHKGDEDGDGHGNELHTSIRHQEVAGRSARLVTPRVEYADSH